MNRTAADKSPVAENTSVFSLRQNWHHLTHRPAHQEPVIDGVRALAILWVVLLHTVFFQFASFPTQVMTILNGSAMIAVSLYVWIERPCMRIRSHPSVLKLIHSFKRPGQELAEQLT